MKDRNKFEYWFRQLSPSVITESCFMRGRDGAYRYTATRIAWLAWCAAIESRGFEVEI